MDEETKSKFRHSLIVAIQKWINAQSDSNDWTNGVGWVGDNLAARMADASLSVILSVSDLNKYLETENMLK